MIVLANLNEHVGRLVHVSARATPIEYLTHRDFLLTRAALALAALVAAPLVLLFCGRPPAWQIIALASSLLPLGATVLVSRTGRIEAGEMLGAATWFGLAAAFAMGHAPVVGLAALLMIPLETRAKARGRSPLLVATLATGFTIAAATLAPGGASHDGANDLGVLLLAGALVYTCWRARGRARLSDVRALEARRLASEHRDLIDLVDGAVIGFDRSGGVNRIDTSVERILSLRADDLLGRGLFGRVHVIDRPAFLKLVADAADGRHGQAVIRLRRGRGQGDAAEYPSFIWTELRVARSGDVPASVAGILRDVSTQRRLEEDLDAARLSAERNETTRDRILANISHELRTPLNAIIGFSEILADAALAPQEPAKRQDYAAIIHRSGHHLLAVVNSILDASKLESGTFAIVPEPFDLPHLIETCHEMVGLTAEQANIRLVRNVVPGLPDVTGDVRACKQILLNLLSNALKFTPRGGRVTLTARPHGTSVLLQVEDTGIGIGPGDLARVGDPFFQAQGGHDRAHQGTGLGLSVVRGLVGLHGGRISIESAPGQGTCVTVQLPIDCRQAALATAVTKIETIAHYRAQGQPSRPAVEPVRIQRRA